MVRHALGKFDHTKLLGCTDSADRHHRRSLSSPLTPGDERIAKLPA